MNDCDKCNKSFSSAKYLLNHQNNINCINKCPICLRKYSNKYTLKKHESVVCRQRFECLKCDKIFNKKHSLKYHLCNINSVVVKNNQITKENEQNRQNEIIDPNLEYVIKNSKGGNPINIHITYNNSNNNSKINNSNNINSNNKLSFENNKPMPLNREYIDDFENDMKYSHYNKHNIQLDEKKLDMYMYETDNFKECYPNDFVLFDTHKFDLLGCQLLYSELQKDPKYQNVRIKKMKSGKCYVYNQNAWEQNSLHKAITKVCSKLCNCLYDRSTVINEYFNEIIITQPRRMTALRKHIENSIMNLNNDQPQIEE